jgi:hypothetical protein
MDYKKSLYCRNAFAVFLFLVGLAVGILGTNLVFDRVEASVYAENKVLVDELVAFQNYPNDGWVLSYSDYKKTVRQKYGFWISRCVDRIILAELEEHRDESKAKVLDALP